MKPRLVTLLTAISLTLSLGTVGLWIRSYLISESIGRTPYGPAISHSRGHLSFSHSAPAPLPPLYPDPDEVEPSWFYRSGDPRPSGWLFVQDTDLLDRYHRIGPFVLVTLTGTTQGPQNQYGIVPWVGVRTTTVLLPHWFIAALWALLAIAAIRRGIHNQRRLTRRRRRLCLHCGYDLRATPDRCPECGTTANPLPAGRANNTAVK